ncbi:MAG: hypothetical protein LBJ01_05670 [Tannerella sp.]|jgi:hypothetical protein|nr:hypothetical protein [Tannerella sp.]
MTSAEMYQWMANPSLLTKSSLFELKQMVDEFPYFHAVRMLYLKNLAILGDVRLGKELKRMAVYIPDRMRLFMLIEDRESNKYRREERKPPAGQANKTDDTLKFIDKILSEEISPSPPPPPAAASDYVNWLEMNADDLPPDEGPGNRLKHQELIDAFIEGENRQHGSRLRHVDTRLNEEKEAGNENTVRQESFEKASLDDSYFTETLAHVYMSQKRYDKALEIIRALSLKYPEKNIYFADQIRYLEKIINIKK